MLNSFVGSQDYQGFGVPKADEIAELRKALLAGSSVNDPGVSPGEGFALRVESLEQTLKNQTFEMDEIKLFKTIPKTAATQTVEEFNRLINYDEGGPDSFDQGFFDEGLLPEEQDSTYERVPVMIKYLGVVGRVSHVAATIKGAHGSNVALETANKTMHMLKNTEYSLFYGDSSLNPLSWDGLGPLIVRDAPDNVIDLRGATLTEPGLNDMLLRIRDNFGQGTDGYFSTGAFADLAKDVYARQRFGHAPAPGVLGSQVNAFQGQNGKINLHDHIFIREGAAPRAAGLGSSAKRPLQPTITVDPAAAANPASLFVADDAGTYIYQVVARNAKGATLPVVSAAVAVVAGDGVTFTITDGGQGTTWYEIYRSDLGGAAGTAKLMTKVARTGLATVVTDVNADIPGTSTGFVLQQNARSFSWSQLLPMTRIPLGAVDTSIRWAQVLYGAVKLYAPKRNVFVKNIGRADGSL